MPKQTQKSPRGQALLEFALTITVLLLLVGGIVDVARMYFAYQTVSEAAHEGAIYGSLHAGDDAGIVSRVTKSSQVMEDAASSGNVAVDITYDTAACANGTNVIKVKVTFDMALHMPVTMAMFGDSLPISATEQAVILQPSCP